MFHGLASDGGGLFLCHAVALRQGLFISRYDAESCAMFSSPCPIVQDFPGMCVRGGHVNIVGGSDGTRHVPYSISLNIEHGSWSSRGQATPGSFPDLLKSQVRIRPNLFCIENEWYAIGGLSKDLQPLPTLKLTSMDCTWYWVDTQLPKVDTGSATVEYDGWFFVVGGLSSSGETLSTVTCINTRNGDVVSLPSIPNRRQLAALAVFREKLVLFGGHNREDKTFFGDVLVLDLSI